MLEGFQLWINLPADHKMDKAAYQEYSAEHIPLESQESGIEVRVITGVTSKGTKGPVVQPLTEPLYLDVRVPAGQYYSEELPASHNAFLYVIHGSVRVENEDGKPMWLVRDDLGVLNHGNVVKLQAGQEDARFLVVAGKPLREPVARGGPFVMNTKAEVQQAFEDYKQGEF